LFGTSVAAFNTATFEYDEAQQGGRWVISQVELPNGETVEYTYAGGKLSAVAHPDGSESSFTFGTNSNAQCTTVSYQDTASSGTHRSKTAYLSNNIVVYYPTETSNQLINQSSMLARMITNGDGEVSYLNMVQSGWQNHLIYEGQGRMKLVRGRSTVKFLKDGWTLGNPADGYAAVSGTYESTYATVEGFSSTGTGQGQFPAVQDDKGIVYNYTYDSDSYVTKKTYSDSTTETWQYNGFKQVTRHEDRLNRVTKTTYDDRGNKLTMQTGILNTGTDSSPTDVNQAEFAEYRWEYYPEEHQNQFLLRYEFDAVSTANGTTNQRKEYIYDSNQFLVEIKEPDDTGTGYHTSTTYTYDSAGRMATSNDALGRTTTFTYDNRDRLVKTTYEDSSTELVIYGAPESGDENLVVKRKDRNGNVTKFEYDDAGRCTKTITAYSTMNADGSSETVITDPAIRTEDICTYLDGTDLKATCVRSGEKTTYAYDYRQRLVGTTVQPRVGKTLTTTSTYVDNLLFSVTDPYGRKSYNAYRASDAKQIRKVQGTVPSFSLSNFAAVTLVLIRIANCPREIVLFLTKGRWFRA
jgi:YD repeat-containing protein